ncbi:Copia protein, partial [Mucuna pruriens]
MTHGICEGLWMQTILDNFKVKYKNPMKLFCNNNSAKEKLDNSLIVIEHVPTRLQVTNVFTKGLPNARFKDLISKFRMIDIHLRT